MGVAFAPEPCGAAFAPAWSGMKWIQGRMWPLLLCGTRTSFRASKGSLPPERVIFTCDVGSARSLWMTLGCDVPTALQSTSRTLWMLWCTIATCYVVTSISSNFEDALAATFQRPFQSTSSRLWMLRCKIHFEQLGRRFGCYVPRTILINFHDTMDATVYHAFRASSKTVWMLRWNSHFIQFPGCSQVQRHKIPLKGSWLFLLATATRYRPLRVS